MLIVRGVSSGVVPYFLDGRAAGRWNDGARELLGLVGEVGPKELRAVLEGCDPRTRTYLPSVRPARRRSGWDLVFAAPKSFSLMVGSADAAVATELLGAHVRAVDGVVSHLGAHVKTSGKAPSAPPIQAAGLVAAAFDHHDNSAGEPHLHTHVLIANLTRADGHWRAVRSEDWFVGRPALAARYHLELRHHLAALGWNLDWRLRPDGMADLADVPRAAVRATSTRSRGALPGRRFAARADAQAWPDWQRSARAAGMAPSPNLRPRAGPGTDLPSGSRSVPGTALDEPTLDDPALDRSVTSRLSSRRSDFRSDDVIIALASSHQGGATSEQVDRWVAAYCARSLPIPSPTRAPRWATEPARRLDNDLAASLGSGRGSVERRRGGPVDGDGIEATLAVSTHLGRAEREIVRSLTGDDKNVHFLAAAPGATLLLSQSEVLESCRNIWVGDGRQVMVSSPTSEAARRWAVLSGLEPYRRGSRPDVLVIDQADRRPTSELASLARMPDTRLVFVEGGTLPRLTNPASHGLQTAAEGAGRHLCGPHRPWVAGTLPDPDNGPSTTGRAAAAAVLGHWSTSSEPVLMVGLGLEEVTALNRAAVGEDRPRARAGRFREGDRVVVHKGGPGRPPYGTFGTVTDVTASGATGIRWDGRPGTVLTDGRGLDGLGFGYAVTAPLAERSRAALVVLGPASALGRTRERVVAEIAADLGRDRRGLALVADRGAWRAG